MISFLRIPAKKHLVPFLSKLPNEVLEVLVGEALCCPIETRAEVVYEPLPGVLLPDLAGEVPCLFEVGSLRLEPD